MRGGILKKTARKDYKTRVRRVTTVQRDTMLNTPAIARHTETKALSPKKRTRRWRAGSVSIFDTDDPDQQPNKQYVYLTGRSIRHAPVDALTHPAATPPRELVVSYACALRVAGKIGASKANHHISNGLEHLHLVVDLAVRARRQKEGGAH